MTVCVTCYGSPTPVTITYYWTDGSGASVWGTDHGDGYGVRQCLPVGNYTVVYRKDGYNTETRYIGLTQAMDGGEYEYEIITLSPTTVTCPLLGDCDASPVGGTCCINNILYTCNSYGNWDSSTGGTCCPSGKAKINFTYSPTGGILYVDGVQASSGGSPPSQICVYSGNHIFRYELDGYIDMETSSDYYQDGGAYSFSFNLVVNPNPCTLDTSGWGTVTVSPYGSKLYVDGIDEGEWSSGTLCLEGGVPHTLRAEYPGYFPATKTVTVTANVEFPVIALVCTAGGCTSGTKECLTATTYHTCTNGVWGASTTCPSGVIVPEREYAGLKRHVSILLTDGAQLRYLPGTVRYM